MFRFRALLLTLAPLLICATGFLCSAGARFKAAGATIDPVATNEKLSDRLEWVFGGKSQRGWTLYLPLISSLLGTDGRVGAVSFSRAVADWQHKAGLAQSGILDQETWMSMVGFWQARRTRSHTTPREALITVPPDDFYDQARPADLRQVEKESYEAYKRMAAAAISDLHLDSAAGTEALSYFKIISAYRSPEYQKMLRAQSPGSGRAGLAVNSPHFTGRALDIYVGGDPVSTRDQNRMIQTSSIAYRWLVRNAGRFGFIPYFYEPWHWEYNPAAG